MKEIPVVNWGALDALLLATERGIEETRRQIGTLTLSEITEQCAGHPDVTVDHVRLLSELCGATAALTRALRQVAPKLARAFGQDPDAPVGYCPRCHDAVALPEGGSIQCHKPCGYCAHPATNGDFCALCGAERGTRAWAEARSLKPGVGASVLMEKGGTGEPPVASEPRVPEAMGYSHD